MQSNYYKKGNHISVTEIQRLAIEKKHVYVQTRCDLTMYPAFELLNWQLQNLLRVELFEAIYIGDQALCDTHYPFENVTIFTNEKIHKIFAESDIRQ